MLSAQIVFAVGTTICAIGTCMLLFPEKFLYRRKEPQLPPLADRAWPYRTPSRVRVMGTIFVLIGGIMLMLRLPEVLRLL